MRLGYACINTTLDVCCNKTCRLATAIKKGEESGYEKGSVEYSLAIYNFLTEMGKNNLEAMYKIIAWSKNNNIFFYRISSGMFPQIGNPQLEEHMIKEHRNNYLTLSFATDILHEIGKYVQKYNIRLSMHPDHFNQMATKDKKVLQNTFRDLYWHAILLDLLELGADAYIKYAAERASQNQEKYKEENVIAVGGTLCIHGGGSYGNKPEAIKRWKANFHKLPENVKRRVCLENCEKSYSVEDLLPICEELKIPLIFDFHHYDCWKHYHTDNPNQSPIEDLMSRILKTWKTADKIPKFHLSDQAEDKKVGAHHDYVEDIPDILLQMYKEGVKFDIMIEAKMKELAVQKLQKKYFFQ